MGFEDRGVEGDWYGMMVHCPTRGMIHVSFVRKRGFFQGRWDFTRISRGEASRGAFKATQFANYLNIRITTRPLADIQCQLTVFNDKGESMITGVIPLEKLRIPFATVTLFRHELPAGEADGICPIRKIRPIVPQR